MRARVSAPPHHREVDGSNPSGAIGHPPAANRRVVDEAWNAAGEGLHVLLPLPKKIEAFRRALARTEVRHRPRSQNPVGPASRLVAPCAVGGSRAWAEVLWPQGQQASHTTPIAAACVKGSSSITRTRSRHRRPRPRGWRGGARLEGHRVTVHVAPRPPLAAVGWRHQVPMSSGQPGGLYGEMTSIAQRGER
jgi:hypothetical protein